MTENSEGAGLTVETSSAEPIAEAAVTESIAEKVEVKEEKVEDIPAQVEAVKKVEEVTEKEKEDPKKEVDTAALAALELQVKVQIVLAPLFFSFLFLIPQSPGHYARE